MSMKMLAGAAAVAALIATPAMAAQQKAADPQHRSLDASSAKKMKKSQARYDSRASYNSRAQAEPRGTGFAPLDFAGAVVGGAVNAAGAIATAPFTPFYGDSYAYYRDANTGRGRIADDNGPVCLPGQMIDISGQRMRCQ